jgi:dTDP-4-dehydrorhamnose 3,5-epimerase
VRFLKTPLEGAYLIELDKRGDERGFFARLFCENEFEAAGLETRFVQINNSLTVKKGALRGLHYQLPPAAEVKVVRAMKGALWDVIVDLRAGSSTYLKWFGAELTEDNRSMMYVPRGFGHGFITLTDNVEALYLDSAFYSPEAERGLRWNDPAIGIDWPAEPRECRTKTASGRAALAAGHRTKAKRQLVELLERSPKHVGATRAAPRALRGGRPGPRRRCWRGSCSSI